MSVDRMADDYLFDGVAELECSHLRRLLLSGPVATIPERLYCYQCSVSAEDLMPVVVLYEKVED